MVEKERPGWGFAASVKGSSFCGKGPQNVPLWLLEPRASSSGWESSRVAAEADDIIAMRTPRRGGRLLLRQRPPKCTEGLRLTMR